MSLARKALRGGVANLLRGHTIAGENITTNRSDPIWHTAVPAIVVFTRREEVKIYSLPLRRLERECRVGIALFVETDDQTGLPIDNQIDDLCQQVEDLINPNMMLPGFFDKGPLVVHQGKSHLESVELEDSPEGLKVIGNALMTYLWTYYTEAAEENAKESGPFLSAGIDWDFAPPTGTPEAQDEITLTPV